MYQHGFPGEKTKDGSVLVHKDHMFYSYNKDQTLRESKLTRVCQAKEHNYAKGVIILRNPANAALAEFNRQNTKGNHTAHAPWSMFQTKWPTFVNKYFSHWKQTYQ